MAEDKPTVFGENEIRFRVESTPGDMDQPARGKISHCREPDMSDRPRAVDHIDARLDRLAQAAPSRPHADKDAALSVGNGMPNRARGADAKVVIPQVLIVLGKQVRAVLFNKHLANGFPSLPHALVNRMSHFFHCDAGSAGHGRVFALAQSNASAALLVLNGCAMGSRRVFA